MLVLNAMMKYLNTQRPKPEARMAELLDIGYRSQKKPCDIQEESDEVFDQIMAGDATGTQMVTPPSPFKVCFRSTAHTDAHIEQTLQAWKSAFSEMVRA